jgi:hypothetical protein
VAPEGLPNVDAAGDRAWRTRQQQRMSSWSADMVSVSATIVGVLVEHVRLMVTVHRPPNGKFMPEDDVSLIGFETTTVASLCSCTLHRCHTTRHDANRFRKRNRHAGIVWNVEAVRSGSAVRTFWAEFNTGAVRRGFAAPVRNHSLLLVSVRRHFLKTDSVVTAGTRSRRVPS